MKFSVLMSIYSGDNSRFLSNALDSIINQSLVPNEIIIVQDGPIGDELKEVVNRFVDRYNFIKVVVSKSNVGLGNALKLGMKYCSYDIVARMDSDDISCYYRFEKQIKLLQEDESLSLIGSNIAEFEDNEENIVAYRKVPSEDYNIKLYAKKRCPINHVTVMFRKKDIEQVGGYKEWHYNEDYYLWIRLILRGYKLSNIDENLVKVRVGSDMYKRRGGVKYFKSEFKLQKLMKNSGFIDNKIFFGNIIIRLIIQIILPNNIRSFVFKKFCRE
ncbi:glycosyltransferase [Clostridium perfringens]|uniref:glycosyltransferase n=1 Tax=Clostridium perfringens TaxID=1502 RepID=UPI0018AC1603|nr:glycosyltransferase [Clostridium perfringens]EJT5931356.1 glycosyltransferase [Clostridium perfringens]EJT6162618.1 glycosyltransferase [Clostridium perfringens]EJT6505104.1 glycosyltransferase [Clostridium perfringens]HEF0383877.1 glycosyltransferase [Clostridium perfringens]